MLRWVSLVLLCSCAGKTANAIRPGDPSYAKTVGERCTMAEASPQPLVVDWRAEERTDLEVAMRRGVVVVAYDCDKLTVLPDCSADGGYGFVAVTPKTQQVKLTNKDEIKANLPAGVLAASATVQRGAALDVNLSIVGKQMSSVVAIDGARLRGRCQGATHFVRAVTTGAFSLTTHTEASVDGEAGAKGAGVQTSGSSDKQIEQHDGDPMACAAVTPSSMAPPRGCATPLRLDLVGIGRAPGMPSAGPGVNDSMVSAGTSEESGACPRNLVWSDGACRTPREADKGRCTSAEGVNECRRMCEDEEIWGACTNLGVAYLEGRFIELDRARALALFERACSHGSSAACYNLSGMLLVGSHGVPADRKRGLELAVKACHAEPKHCANAAIAYRDGIGTPRNPARSAELFSRACIGGKPEACWDLARAYYSGSGVAKDLSRSHELTMASCNGGYLHACAAAAGHFMFGTGVPKDDNLAMQWASYTCERRTPLGCSILGYYHVHGRAGLRRDKRKGFELMRWACENDTAGNTCEILGAAYIDHKNERDGRYYMQKACDAGVESACKHAQPPPPPPARARSDER